MNTNESSMDDRKITYDNFSADDIIKLESQIDFCIEFSQGNSKDSGGNSLANNHDNTLPQEDNFMNTNEAIPTSSMNDRKRAPEDVPVEDIAKTESQRPFLIESENSLRHKDNGAEVATIYNQKNDQISNPKPLERVHNTENTPPYLIMLESASFNRLREDYHLPFSMAMWVPVQLMGWIRWIQHTFPECRVNYSN